MKLIFQIAFRYLLGKKSTHAIHIITWISMIGMALGTAALILILSVFNGFEGLLSGMLSHFNPDVKVTLVRGKYQSVDGLDVDALKSIPGIAQVSFSLEETCFFSNKESQEVGIIKGVDEAYVGVTGLDTAMVSGQIKSGQEAVFAVMGSGMHTKLSVNPYDPFALINAYMPSRDGGGPLDMPFTALPFYVSGTFSVGSEVDMQYVVVDIASVNRLLGLENHFSAIELRLQDDASEKEVISAVMALLGSDYAVQNRYQQDESFLKIMQIEKWISYLIACLTMCIIAFNLIGSLWMIVLDKRKDIAILQSIGFTRSDVKKLFLSLGLLISAIGLVFGFVIAVIFYILQKNYGIIGIPQGFLIDAYPVEMRIADFMIVTVTVLCIGYVASLLPSMRAARVSPYLRMG
jgi:lipoprotein-releasing system permease protein